MYDLSEIITLRKNLKTLLYRYKISQEEYFDFFNLNLSICSSSIFGCCFNSNEAKEYLNNGILSKGKDFLDYLVLDNIYRAQNAFMNYIDTNRPLTATFLKELGIMLLNGIEFYNTTFAGKKINKQIIKGKFRDEIDKTLITENQLDTIQLKIEKLLENVHYQSNFTIEFIADFFYNFVKIHPFEFGNGRLSRIIINYPVLKAGYLPIIFSPKDKNHYEIAIKSADEKSNKNLELLIFKKIVESYNLFIEFIETKSNIL